MMPSMEETLDRWVADPALRVAHRRHSEADPDRLWTAAQSVRIDDAQLLGRLVRWRIPGTPGELTFDEMFRRPPFLALDNGERLLVAGLVGRIWTLRRDYPELSGPDEFSHWSAAGTARVLFANWVQADSDGGATLCSEVRVEAFGPQGRLGLATVRPLVRAFQQLIGSDGISAAVRRAEAAPPARGPRAEAEPSS
jgi:hypothetical protein